LCSMVVCHQHSAVLTSVVCLELLPGLPREHAVCYIRAHCTSSTNTNMQRQLRLAMTAGRDQARSCVGNAAHNAVVCSQLARCVHVLLLGSVKGARHVPRRTAASKQSSVMHQGGTACRTLATRTVAGLQSAAAVLSQGCNSLPAWTADAVKQRSSQQT
jgi:hypothetical protein